ncbi:MAG: AAA family ATPase [Planctomycetaceae bacterium]|nr:AAA family ATPase [Planctomycetaceae bacterium]
MYSQHWNLERPPFENTLDPEFFFPSQSHQAAVLKLRYLIENQKGAGVLVGATGAGKTFVTRRLAHDLSQQAGPWLHFPFPQMSPDDLLNDLAIRLAGESVMAGTPPHSLLPRSSALRLIEQSLDEHTHAGRHPVIIIDDAHLIDDPATLQTLELLLNFQQAPQRVFSLILLGDRLLLSRLSRLPRFEDRLAIRAMLQSLSADETARYVRFRLEIAGARNSMFDAAALEEIAQLSGGVPRRINRLADLALLVGYADGRHRLTASDVSNVSEELAVVGVD